VSRIGAIASIAGCLGIEADVGGVEVDDCPECDEGRCDRREEEAHAAMDAIEPPAAIGFVVIAG
jgi:hypothetical protein